MVCCNLERKNLFNQLPHHPTNTHQITSEHNVTTLALLCNLCGTCIFLFCLSIFDLVMCSLFSNNIQKIIIMCGTQLTLPTPCGDTTRDALELQPIFPGNITPWAESTHFRSLKIWYLNPVFFCMINWYKLNRI